MIEGGNVNHSPLASVTNAESFPCMAWCFVHRFYSQVRLYLSGQFFLSSRICLGQIWDCPLLRLDDKRLSWLQSKNPRVVNWTMKGNFTHSSKLNVKSRKWKKKDDNGLTQSAQAVFHTRHRSLGWQPQNHLMPLIFNKEHHQVRPEFLLYAHSVLMDNFLG